MKRDLTSIHTISTLQDASRFHDIGVGKSSTRFSNIGDLNTFHKGYSASLHKRGKAPMDIDAVNSRYNETSIAKDINNVKKRIDTDDMRKRFNV